MSVAALGLIVFFTVCLGSFLQWASGMGLGLVASSVLSIVLGPVSGVVVVNLLAAVNAAFITITVWSRIDWRKFALIGSPMILGALPGALMVQQFSTAVLQIIIGTALLLALALAIFGARLLPKLSGALPAIGAGMAGGFMNTIAGVAGPAITVYAQLSCWDHSRFAATLQPIFVVAGILSLTTKIAIIGMEPVQQTHPVVGIAGLVAMGTGIWIGTKAEQRISREKARTVALSIAVLGGASALTRGLLAVLGS